MLRRVSSASGIALIALVLPLWSQGPASNASEAAHAPAGRRVFSSACAGCHGLDGRGGERAPDLAAPKVRRLSNRELLAIVRNGVPGTAMPAFHALPQQELRGLLAYLRDLQGAKPAPPLSGDPRRGETLFFGKAKCSACHMADGKGGFIASDLSAYGRSHSPQEILHRILTPQNDDRARDSVAVVTTNDGQKIRGIVRNEDNFSLQLQSLDGVFHLLTKSELHSVEYEAEPLMPGNYGSLLPRQELDDIVRYLMELAGGPTTGARNQR